MGGAVAIGRISSRDDFCRSTAGVRLVRLLSPIGEVDLTVIEKLSKFYPAIVELFTVELKTDLR